MHQHHHASPTPGFSKSLSRSGQVFFDNSFVEYSSKKSADTLRAFFVFQGLLLNHAKELALGVCEDNEILTFLWEPVKTRPEFE